MKYPLLTGVSVLLLLCACSTTSGIKSRTGFLKEYTGLKQVDKHGYHYFQNLDNADLSLYDKIFIPEIKVIANTEKPTPKQCRLYKQIAAYTTAAYRKNIMKRSANYTLVDVAQKGTLLMQIAVSAVEVHLDDDEWDNLRALPLALNDMTRKRYQEGTVRLLIEARISDAMSNKPLARSMRVIMEEEVHTSADDLEFKQLQASLDRWLYTAAVKY